MGKRGLGRAIACLAAVAMASCSLLIPAGDLSKDTLDAGPLDGPPIGDGATDLTDALPEDAGADCDATFCDDFESSPFGAQWTGTMVVGGGAIGRVEGGRSGAGAAATLPEGGVANRTAMLIRRFSSPKRITCDFSIRPEIVNEQLRSFGFAITASGYSRYAVYLQLRTSATSVVRSYVAADGAAPFDIFTVPYLATGSWADVRMTTDFKTVEVYLGGALVKTLPSHAIDVTTVDIELGLDDHGSEAALAIFDDVRCTVER